MMGLAEKATYQPNPNPKLRNPEKIPSSPQPGQKLQALINMIASPEQMADEQAEVFPNAGCDSLETHHATGISEWISGDLRKIAERRLEQLDCPEPQGKNGFSQVFEDLALHQIELEIRGTKLEREKQSYSDYFENVPLPSLRVDANGEIVEANSSAHALLFRISDESQNLSQRFARQMSEPDLKKWDDFLGDLHNQCESASAEISLPPAGHPPLSFRVCGKQLDGGDCWVFFEPGRTSRPDITQEFSDKNSEEKHVLTDLALRFLQAEVQTSGSNSSESLTGSHPDITNLCDQAGMLMKIQSLGTEITERKKAEAAFSEAAAKARQASEAKTEFIANMSHEIRTPMSGIIGISELLLESGLNDHQTHYVRMLHSSARSVLALMNDILDISKIEAGKIELESLVFDLGEMLANFGEEWKIVAQGKGLALEVIASPNLPHWVCGDKNRLRQILMNLTSNALKFTETGGIKISAVSQLLHEGEACLQFEVSDTGEGIPDGKMSRLFERFMQADTSVSRKHGGTGLGLTICKELVTLMRGEIGVESTYGNGSRFWFTVRMPVCEKSGLGNEENRQVTDSAPLVGNVLLVEDFVPNQLVIREMLLRLGLQCDSAMTGHQALEKLASKPYDIVLMDVQIPGIDGIETTMRLRKGKSVSFNHKIPVIALTGHASKESRDLCLRAGMNDHLTKPVEKKQLAAKLRRWLAGTVVSQSVNEVPSHETRPSTGLGEMKIYDNAVLLQSLDGDMEAWHAFAKSCLLGIAEEKSRLQGWNDGNLTDVAVSAHSLKGTAGYLGATALKDSAGRLEIAARAGDRENSVELLQVVKSEIDVLLEAIRTDLMEQGAKLD